MLFTLSFLMPALIGLGIYDAVQDDGDSNEAQGHNITGTEQDDVLSSQRGADFIQGLGGDDLLSAGKGDDTLSGGAGDDDISGGHGNDSITGEEGNDVLAGNRGNDLISAGVGDDVVHAGSGHDVALGQDGDDHIVGESGNDIIHTGAGDDTASGSVGHDWVDGGSGEDTINGGYGMDTVIGGTGADEMRGSLGQDLLIGGGFESLEMNQTEMAAFRDGVSLADILDSDPSDHAVLRDDGAADTLHGGQGDDTLYLGAHDSATGDDGHDVFAILSQQQEDSANQDAGHASILDYNSREDSLVLVVDGESDPDVSVHDDGDDCVISINGNVLARVDGAAGMISASDISFVTSPTLAELSL